MSWPSDLDEGLRSIHVINVLKRLDLSLLDRDPAITMLPARLHLVRYNAFNKGTCFDPDAVGHGPLDRRSIIHRTPDPTPCVSPRHLHLKQKKLKSHTEKIKGNRSVYKP